MREDEVLPESIDVGSGHGFPFVGFWRGILGDWVGSSSGIWVGVLAVTDCRCHWSFLDHCGHLDATDVTRVPPGWCSWWRRAASSSRWRSRRVANIAYIVYYWFVVAHVFIFQIY